MIIQKLASNIVQYIWISNPSVRLLRFDIKHEQNVPIPSYGLTTMATAHPGVSFGAIRLSSGITFVISEVWVISEKEFDRHSPRPFVVNDRTPDDKWVSIHTQTRGFDSIYGEEVDGKPSFGTKELREIGIAGYIAATDMLTAVKKSRLL